jgi:tRNA(fMet)-specific endonuclease VapC
MLVLDTNHLSEIDRDTSLGRRLRERLGGNLDDTCVTIISAEELLRGWLALIRSSRDSRAQIQAYSRLSRCLSVLNDWTLLSWDEDTAQIFVDLRRKQIRVGTLDLRIASIALAYDATVLSRNLVDFRQASRTGWTDRFPPPYPLS